MFKLVLLCVVLAEFSPQATAQQSDSSAVAPENLRTGVVISKVSCLTESVQSYALYLPSHYTPEKRWPIVYAFDPDALGSVPVELMKDAAERYGYIVAGSNNSHNGAWKLGAQAAQAMIQDTRMRLSIDDNRAYFAGFSGGARLALVLARQCKCAAGVLMNSAGLGPGPPQAPDATFAVFATAGTTDFNYGEVVTMDAKLETLHCVHAFSAFAGTHSWAPASVMDKAFAWFRLMAMKDGRQARELAFVKEQAAEAERRAKDLELAGDLYGSWKEYRQAADTFTGFDEDLNEAAAFRNRATTLEKEKAVLDGAKNEQQEFEEQARLTADISSGLSTLRRDSADNADRRSDLEQQISGLRVRAEHDKNPQKVRVFQRALGGIFVEAMERGDECYEAKDFSHARAFYELGVSAKTDSSGAWRLVAAARAMTGDRKGAFEAIRQAKERSKDSAAFLAWIQQEPAFDKFRNAPEFRALIVSAQDTP
jgi:tetratricopeptide (TPR) repeat protein